VKAYLSKSLMLVSLVVMSSCSVQSTNPDDRPNFVFIAIDDLNDWVGYMGGHPQARTPNLDALASSGTAFMNAQSVAPGCSPSRNALLYGVEPFNSGLYPFYEHEIHKQLHKKYVSLPQLLKSNGYLTYGTGKIHHGPEKSKLEWTAYFDAKPVEKRYAEGKGFHGKDPKKLSYRPVTNDLDQLTDYQVANHGIDIIKRKHRQPFFVGIGIVKPHLPLDCPEQFYQDSAEPILAPNLYSDDLSDIPAEGNSMRRSGDDNRFRKNGQWEDVRRAYLACVSWVDYNVGRIIEAIESGPNADNTVVVLWSDHGFHLGEKRSFRKFTLWEESSRVPFIIDDRRLLAGKKVDRVDHPVTLINLYKTIAEMARIEAPDYVDGFSLTSMLTDHNAVPAVPAISSWGRGNYSVRTKQWRYIRYFDSSVELYNHYSDPDEWHNLANDDAYQVVVAELDALLPTKEAPTVEEFIAPWSLYGADKERLKALYESAAAEQK